MRLTSPHQAIDFETKDIFGKPFHLNDLIGNRVVLSFFRDAACPFCNYRIYELTQKYSEWKKAGLEIVVVFSDTDEQVKKYIAKRPRPFTMICDPELKLYNKYGVEKSALALFKAVFINSSEIIRGFLKGAKPSNNPHMTIVPADFLIDVDGEIRHVWYGRDTADHIPMKHLIKFGSAKTIRKKQITHQEFLNELRKENKRIKALLDQ